MSNIAIVGEAWGEEEARQRMPFVGPSGYALTKMLEEAGIRRADCFLTNVFNLRPDRNDIETLCGNKAEDRTGLPSIRNGKYIRAEFLPEVNRLKDELIQLLPNITIALGNTASWALLGNAGISKIRGTVSTGRLVPGLKILPTYHPAAVLRDWSLRPVTVLDLAKAFRESTFPEIRRPERIIYTEPCLQDLEWFYETHIQSCKRLSVDIETSGEQITCIGFAPSTSIGFVIPFVDYRKPGGNYWPTKDDEICAWEVVRRILATPQPKIFQNGLYDIHFLWRSYGLPVVNAIEDTMLLHHALHPESEKGLAFMGSVYTNESSWKLIRARGKTTIKRDE